MTGVEQAQYQKMPTDESEAQTLASADLDYMKSEWGLGLAGEGLWGARSCAGHCKAGAVHGASGAGAGRAGLGAGSGRRGCRAPSTGRSSASGAQPGAGTQGGWSRRRRRCLPRGLSGLQLRDFQGCFCRNSSLGASLPSAHPQPVGKGCRAAAAHCWPPLCAGACQHTAPIPPGRVPPPAPVAPGPVVAVALPQLQSLSLPGGYCWGRAPHGCVVRGALRAVPPHGLPTCLHRRPSPFLAGHRFEDVPGVRRHLVRKSAKAQVVHVSKDHKEPSTRHRKQDRQPHEVGSVPGGAGARRGSHCSRGCRGGAERVAAPRGSFPTGPSCSGPGERGLPAHGPPAAVGCPR